MDDGEWDPKITGEVEEENVACALSAFFGGDYWLRVELSVQEIAENGSIVPSAA
jgi:hypothetical protein